MARKVKLTMVDKGELGHIYPQTVVYNVGRKNYLLAEDEEGNYLVKPVYENGTLGDSIVSKNFGCYYDIIQAAYDDVTATTYICAVSLAGKTMEVYAATTLGLVSRFEFDYVIDDRKTFNFFFIEGRLYVYQGGEDANGKYTVTSIRVTEE
ncbi:hypothetical protein JC794_02980 [Morganella morganii]|uniref:hypothetical protein n=1 Tax=Morganella morganii TaxID=582 RepID=UPI000D1F72F5|nr:hypothetical protein [Morganella morganii]HAE77655.1 hypothetical protein [Morganella sp. (in: enterobacteria)]QXO43285.1 hypothetical protein CXB74_003070 [Morganella morganii]QXO46873.1 hypothetical protein JC862_02970 [Morganella morganii]QXO50634.1 hypothetical protein JC861_03075 [Morganella morganii]QXO54482.1 hypothetical protein JC830_02975 [Morganella morganii]